MNICNSVGPQSGIPCWGKRYRSTLKSGQRCAALRGNSLMTMTQNIGADAGSNELSASLRRNIQALRERRTRERMSASFEERLANSITGFTGSMRFVYAHLPIYRAWIISDLIPQIPHFHPTLLIVEMLASVAV